jgi:TctA family transporter
VKNLLQPPPPEVLFGFGILALMIAIAVIWFVVAILIAVWVYRDAESRGESGALWLIIVLITGIIGLIIWLIVRGDKPKVTS